VRYLTTRVKSYRRRGYYRKDGTWVKPTTVKGYIRKVKDRGAPGRGRKVIPPLKKGVMTREAIKLGLLKPGQRIKDLSEEDIVKLAEHLRKKYGQRKAWGMFHAQLVLRKRLPNGFKRKMEIGREVAKGKPGVWD